MNFNDDYLLSWLWIKVDDNETKIDEVSMKQERQNLKIQDIENRQDEYVTDLGKQKQYINDINLSLSDQIGTVELGLAQDLETLKVNVEQGMVSSNKKHSSLEEKLKDFTVEI